VLLGAMALFLAALNRRLLIDTSDEALDRAAEQWLAGRDVAAQARSLILDNERAILFVHATAEVPQSFALGEALKLQLKDRHGKTVDAVFWKFMPPGTTPPRRTRRRRSMVAPPPDTA
jgi:hypothetical protein